MAVIELLLGHRPPFAVDAVNRAGETPLHCAARNGHRDCVVRLVEGGANVKLKTKAGVGACQLARVNRHRSVATWLAAWPPAPPPITAGGAGAGRGSGSGGSGVDEDGGADAKEGEAHEAPRSRAGSAEAGHEKV